MGLYMHPLPVPFFGLANCQQAKTLNKMFNVIINKVAQTITALDKLTRPKRLVLFCVTGHTQTPNYSKFLRLFTWRRMFSSLAHLQNKNPENVSE